MNKIELDRIVFIGRSMREYVDIYGLSEHDLYYRSILDCPAGPSSFVAEAASMGHDVTGCDIAYGLSAQELSAKGQSDIAEIAAKLKGNEHLYDWDYYGSIDSLISHRYSALNGFLADYPDGRECGRYAHAALPNLPYDDRVFELVLSGHYQFLYSEFMDYDTQLASLRELMRVCAGELRVFPIVGLDGKPYEHLVGLIEALGDDGFDVNLRKTEFKFQKGSDSMLSVRRKT